MAAPKLCKYCMCSIYNTFFHYCIIKDKIISYNDDEDLIEDYIYKNMHEKINKKEKDEKNSNE